jgi:hypothetical protein
LTILKICSIPVAVSDSRTSGLLTLRNMLAVLVHL